MQLININLWKIGALARRIIIIILLRLHRHCILWATNEIPELEYAAHAADHKNAMPNDNCIVSDLERRVKYGAACPTRQYHLARIRIKNVDETHFAGSRNALSRVYCCVHLARATLLINYRKMELNRFII